MLADPGLVIVQPVEMLDQLHVALDGERRVLAQRMKRGEEDSGSQIAVLHVVFLRWLSCQTVLKPPSAMMIQPVT